MTAAKNYEDYIITVTLTGVEHTHKWSYTANGDTITAT